MLLEIDGHKAQAVHSGLRRSSEGLPEMNGYEVARRIRSLKGLERVRLVALSGYGQSDDKQRTRDAGFDDHLVKPVDFEVLQRILL